MLRRSQARRADELRDRISFHAGNFAGRAQLVGISLEDKASASLPRLGSGNLPSWNALIMQVSTKPEKRFFGTRIRRFLEGLGPYQSLITLALPTTLVEPLKLVAVAVAGEGHWITGTLMIVAAYATSLLLVERLFRIVKPKLLTLRWFARMWSCVVITR